MNLKETVQDLTQKLDVTNERDSQVISVTAQDKDPKVASEIANVTAEVFKDEVAKIMSVDNVTVLSKAEVLKNSHQLNHAQY